VHSCAPSVAGRSPIEENPVFRSAVVACVSVLALVATVIAVSAAPAGAAAPSQQTNRPLFAVLRAAGVNADTVSPPIRNWTFSYTYGGRTYNDVILGKKPSSDKSTTIPVYLIPIKLKVGTVVANPLATLPNGRTVVANTLDSPIFQSGTTFTQGGTDVGDTQYLDAVQRASFWGSVSSDQGYHVLLGTPKVEPEVTYKVPAADGTTAVDFGVSVLNVDINWFDQQVNGLISSLHIPATAIPIFEITQTYMTEDGDCCIGGYHSVTGAQQPYIATTYIQSAGTFSQDVSALTHEVAETLNDPSTFNNSPCGVYEVGDPLEGEPNYGAYPYTLNGFTYHLQDIVLPPYFGAPTSTSVNGWSTFQGTSKEICQNGA
jgi:hypothetical protein